METPASLLFFTKTNFRYKPDNTRGVYRFNNRSIYHYFILIFLFFFTVGIRLQGQTRIEGRVVDSENGDPLAFVNIVHGERNQGTTSNVDGSFAIQVPAGIQQLKFSYVGYQTLDYGISLNKTKGLLIRLQKNQIPIREVTVVAGTNPAHRIIEQAIHNRPLNDPEKMASFQYTSYNKFIVTADLDTSKAIKRKSTPQAATRKSKEKEVPVAPADSSARDSLSKARADSGLHRARKFLDNQYLFLTESVSERKFLQPDRNHEKIVATKVSGLSNPSFALLTTQIQSFSFYKDLIKILEKSYLNPISSGSTTKYFFSINDTLLNSFGDTIYIISFKPGKGKNFTGLKGTLSINSSTYAIESVIAEPDSSKGLEVKIQQKYEFIDRTQWFPVQLNTDIIFRNLQVAEDQYAFFTIGKGTTYLSEIVLNPPLSTKEFGHVALVLDEKEAKRDDQFWQLFRKGEFGRKDSLTYRFMDSLGQAEKFDLKLRIFEALGTGYIPFHFLNIDYSKIISANRHEGIRLGLDARTNYRISTLFSVGGSIAIGLRDNALKYGGNLSLFPLSNPDWDLTADYLQDVSEMGSIVFFEDARTGLSSERFRAIMVKDMYRVSRLQASTSFRALDYARIRLYLQTREEVPLTDYAFVSPDYPVVNGERDRHYHFAEVGIQIKYAFREKFIQSLRTKFSAGTDYPIVWLQLARGLKVFSGDFGYSKIDLQVRKSLETGAFGKTDFFFRAGFLSGTLPLTNLYSGRGSYVHDRPVHSDFSFNTMQPGEFFSDRYSEIHLKQNFGTLLLKTKRFRPELCLTGALLFGSARAANRASNQKFKVPEKGYFENGLLINSLIDNGMLNFGVGFYHRWGPYRLQDFTSNSAIKLTLNFNF